MRKLIKEYKKLNQKKYREDQKLFLVEGMKINRMLWSDKPELVKQVLYCQERLTNDEFEDITQLPFLKEAITESELNAISDTGTPQPVVSVAAIPASFFNFNGDDYTRSDLIIFLDRVRDPGNLGVIIRTSIWFGFNRFILFNCADLFSPKVIRSTGGAVFEDAKIFITDVFPEECIAKLKDSGFKIITTEMTGQENIFTGTFPEKYLIVFSNEPGGVSDELLTHSDLSIFIPGSEQLDSLNVSVAAGIVLGMFFKQKRK
ncbi:MAG: RNA methyltransferase [bacterium]|nr:RNA methyltransferase [bacterium]